MKRKLVNTAIPIYGCAALWLLLGLICPQMLLKPWFLVLAAGLSTVIYFLISKKSKIWVYEQEEAPDTGDKAVDALIHEGRASLENIDKANAEIPDEQISAKLNRMVRAGREILRILEHDVSKASAVRRFMNYYLPTAEKLMSAYRMMQNSAGAGENIAQAKVSIENSLDMIANAFEKQLDNLYSDRKLDIETDIEVLETMMAADGLIRPNNMHN